MATASLHLMCGKIASGKSTLASVLATRHGAILLSEDQWLAGLYPEEIRSVSDYVQRARRLRTVLGPLVTRILASGVSVVLDFPANRIDDRSWLLSLARTAQARHCLHYLQVDDDTCRARLHARNQRQEHEFAATDAEFDLITGYFQPPGDDEGLAIVIHPA